MGYNSGFGILPSGFFSNNQEKHIKKKIVKRVKKQQEEQVAEDGVERRKLDQRKSYQAEQERKWQYEQIEAKNHRNAQERKEEIERLRDALVVSEIIGRPRCKTRRNSRTRRI